MNGDASWGFEEQDFDEITFVSGSTGFGEIVVNEPDAERVIDEDLVASASLVSFSASKEKGNALEGPLIGSMDGRHEAFELTP